MRNQVSAAPDVHTPSRPLLTINLLRAAVGLWFVLVVLFSWTGVLGRLSPYAIPPIAFGMMFLGASAFWLVPAVRQRVEAFGLRGLTALHISRALAVPLFFWYGARGLLPTSFVNHAGWGDLVSAVVALVVVLFWPARAGYWVAHVVGMADFMLAFGTAMAHTRAAEHSMQAVTGLPAAMIPFFFVGVLGATHLMAYSLLLASGRGQRGEMQGSSEHAS